MRIGFVICGDLAHVSGGFHYDRQLIAGLRAQGAEIEVIALPWRRYRRALADNLTAWPQTAGRFDLIIQDQLCHPAVFLRNRRWRRAGVPVVSLVHNLTSCQPGTRLRPLVRGCESWYFRGIDAVLAVCDTTLADVRACGGGALPACVARPGRAPGPVVEAAALAARAQAAGPLRLLFTGVVAPHKGLHRLLPVLSQLNAVPPPLPAGPAVRLEVAGSLRADPGYVAALQAEIDRRQLRAHITVHGQLDPTQLDVLRARCHLFVMPSDREAYPLAALEALGAGLPVLLTDAGGTAELLGSSGAGALLPPDAPAAWVQLIAALAHDRPRLLTLARAALARHQSQGTWAETAAQVAPFLATLTAVTARAARA